MILPRANVDCLQSLMCLIRSVKLARCLRMV